MTMRTMLTGAPRPPYRAASAPTVNNDVNDTAGIGRKFLTAELWLDTAAVVLYECLTNGAGTALWVEVARSKLLWGALPAGESNDYGIQTPDSSNILGIWSARTSGAGNISHEVVANVGVAAIDAAHNILVIGWIDNGGTLQKTHYFRDDELEIGAANSAWLLGTEADGGSAIGAISGCDNAFSTAGAKLHSFQNNGVEKGHVTHDGNLVIQQLPNGQQFGFSYLTEETTIAAAAFTDTTIQIPAECQVIGVSSYVTTTIPTAVTYTVGVAGSVAIYGTSAGVAAGTSLKGMDLYPRYYGAAASVRITPSASPATATGKVRITIHYQQITAPTS